MSSGRHVRVSRKDVEQAVLLHVAATYRGRGIQCPSDADFLKRARFTFIGADGKEIRYVETRIVWDE